EESGHRRTGPHHRPGEAPRNWRGGDRNALREAGARRYLSRPGRPRRLARPFWTARGL
ncbi:MAG: hypothetical protein AVDCRST_MAG04-2741, partial [uncultured Acetobacteraceae bacterium]